MYVCELAAALHIMIIAVRITKINRLINKNPTIIGKKERKRHSSRF